MKIQIKRVYDAPAHSDGLRVLIDRLWPRGVKKEDAAIDVWAKDIAPSGELRKWFGHDEQRFDEFARRYRNELAKMTDAIDEMFASAKSETITLVYGAKDTQHNNAVVLQAWLQSKAR